METDAKDKQRVASSDFSNLEQERMVEALLFAAAEPLTLAELRLRLPGDCQIEEVLGRLSERYAGRGVRLVRAGNGWAFRTAPDLGFLMLRERVVPKRMSRAAMETLAIIAYHQPVTRSEIEEFRGVTTSRGSLDRLIELGWIGLGRRRATPGRPTTFVTTRAFLDHFGLESARDLPGLKELREAGLLETHPPLGFLDEAAADSDSSDELEE